MLIEVLLIAGLQLRDGGDDAHGDDGIKDDGHDEEHGQKTDRVHHCDDDDDHDEDHDGSGSGDDDEDVCGDSDDSITAHHICYFYSHCINSRRQ